MTHARTQIRQEAVRLLNAAPGIAPTVEDNRAWFTAQTALPALSVYTDEDDTDGDADSMGADERVLALTVEIKVSSADGAGAALEADNLAELVEDALMTDTNWQVSVSCVGAPVTAGVNRIEGEEVNRTLSLVFPVMYRTAPGASGVLL